MIIPNDTGHPWRLNKYLEYMRKVPPINPTTYMEFIRRNGLTLEESLELAWYIATTYSVETSIFLFYLLPFYRADDKTFEAFWAKYKQPMIFISARKYVKSMDWFVPLMQQFKALTSGGIFPYMQSVATTDNPQTNYKQLYNALMGLRYMGRFSVDLFMEAVVYYSDIDMFDGLRFQYEAFNWKDGSNITTGLMNVNYKDEWADAYDKAKTLTDEQHEWLEERVVELQQAVAKRYPDQSNDIAIITPKLCSFRNLWKGARYGGYHHDRQLGIIIGYEQDLPEFNWVWDELYQIRSDIFQPGLLGEVGGWTGIRKERKTLWRDFGLTGVEDVEYP